MQYIRRRNKCMQLREVGCGMRYGSVDEMVARLDRWEVAAERKRRLCKNMRLYCKL